jgi:hypothetical protein
MSETNTEYSPQNQSETIGELAKALCKMQSEMGSAKKGSENPFFHSKYADLSSVWQAIQEPLTRNGLAISQLNRARPEGIVLRTMLMHSSGEWLSGEIFVRAEKPGPQAFGSAMTYARRYALAAIVGLTQEDDDGNSATQAQPQYRGGNYK